MTIRHRLTGLLGTIRDEAARFSPWDGDPGPWYLVEWDDGFVCWVPARVTRPA